METYDILLLAYAAFEGTIKGKTNLQKRIYFLGQSLGLEKELEFFPHFYGPFSSKVEEANLQLKSLGYLSETFSGGGAVDKFGREIGRYDYSLTLDGNIITERKKLEYADMWSKIQEAVSKLNNAGNLNYIELSIAAKAFYIVHKKGAKCTFREITDAAKTFGWEVEGYELEKAKDFLIKIGLVCDK